MRTVSYVRVSSKAQNHRTQVDAIERAYPDVVHGYREKMSAKTTARPELRRMLDDARAGRFDRLVVFRLDRLCRSGVADTFAVLSELRRAGVTVVALAEGLTIKPGSDVTSDVLTFAFGLAAQLERAAINDRIAAARTRVEAEGGVWGRPRRMTAAQVDTAKKMRAKGQSVRAIAQAIGVPRATIGRAVAAV